MAATAPNMGLKVWNLLTDSYDHAQLAENLAKIDQHNHTEGKGVQIPTGGLENGSVSASKIGNEQVSPEKLTTSATEGVGINTPSRTYRSFSSNEATYSSSTTSYTLVDSGTVYVPTNGRLMASYVALHKSTTSNGSIQIFVDEVELKLLVIGGVASAMVPGVSEFGSFFGPLTTVGGSSSAFSVGKGVTADSSYVTTGMATQGGTMVIFNMPVGTHKVEIKAKAGVAGKIEIKNRFLWLRGEGYA